MIFSLILSLFFWQMATPPNPSDRELARLKGEVNYISVQQAAVINEAGKIVEGRRESVSLTVYDPQGRMQEYTFNPNARSVIKRTFKYDADGKRQEGKDHQAGRQNGGREPWHQMRVQEFKNDRHAKDQRHRRQDRKQRHGGLQVALDPECRTHRISLVLILDLTCSLV